MIRLRSPNFLVSKRERSSTVWGRGELLKGERNVLRNPLIATANERILETFEPSHSTVIFSLCSATRPYYKSPKWKKFIENFGKEADLVICSNGGVVPIEYSHSWPFMDYDAGREGSRYDEEYIDTLGLRITKFLETFNYSKVIHVFKHDSRNAEVVKRLGLPGSILPSKETYSQMQGKWREGKDFYYRMHPHAHPLVISEIRNHIDMG